MTNPVSGPKTVLPGDAVAVTDRFSDKANLERAPATKPASIANHKRSEHPFESVADARLLEVGRKALWADMDKPHSGWASLTESE